MKKLERVRHAVAFLELCELGDAPFDLSVGYGSDVRLAVDKRKLTARQYRECKRQFGPLTVEDEYGSGKRELGKRTLSNGLALSLTVTAAYSCTPRDVGTMTDADWLAVREQAAAGVIVIPNCEANDTLADDS